MIDWKRVPWPLFIYSAFVLLAVIAVDVEAHGPMPAKVLYVALVIAWLYFLLKGVRWVWIATLAAHVLTVVHLISGSLTLLGLVGSLVGLTLLLLPAVRRYVFSHTDVIGP